MHKIMQLPRELLVVVNCSWERTEQDKSSFQRLTGMLKFTVGTVILHVEINPKSMFFYTIKCIIIQLFLIIKYTAFSLACPSFPRILDKIIAVSNKILK